MNFDQLKEDWNTTEGKTPAVSADMLKMKAAHTPIDKIRTQMKSECYVQLLALLCFAFAPRLFGFAPVVKPVFIAFYAVACGFTVYYFFKFYNFYKSSYNLSLDTRKNLLWFYYEMKVNIELYKALTYILSFIALAFLTAYAFLTKPNIHHLMNKANAITIILVCFSTIFLVGLFTELWAKYYYGSQLKQVKLIIDQLDNE